MGKTIYGVASWIRHDTYVVVSPISRWDAFKAFIEGKLAVHWLIPATRKDKRLRLTGKLKRGVDRETI